MSWQRAFYVKMSSRVWRERRPGSRRLVFDGALEKFELIFRNILEQESVM